MRIFTWSLLSGALLLLALGYLHMQGDPATPVLPEARTSYLELMPESSGENPRLHHRGPDGFDRWIDLSYQNGETGKLIFGEKGKLQEAIYRFADGSLRKTMRFAADGKTLTEGFELRASDRSTIWRTESVNRNAVSVTTVYWAGGKQVFSVVEESRQQGVRSSKFYRQDGTLQLARTENASGVLLSEKVFDQAGTLRSSLTSSTGATQVDYFRANGTLDFRQLYESYDYQKSGPEGQSIAAVARILQKVLVLGDDGDTVMRVLTIAGGYKPFVQQELKANEDGTRSRFVLDEKGQVITAKRLGKDNRQIDGFVEAKGVQHDFDPLYTAKPGGRAAEVFAEWKAEEAKASKH